MQGPKLCTKPRHFCNLDMAIARHFTYVHSMCFVTEKSGLCFIFLKTILRLKFCTYRDIHIYILTTVLTTSKYKLNLHEHVVYYTD